MARNIVYRVPGLEEKIKAKDLKKHEEIKKTVEAFNQGDVTEEKAVQYLVDEVIKTKLLLKEYSDSYNSLIDRMEESVGVMENISDQMVDLLKTAKELADQARKAGVRTEALRKVEQIVAIELEGHSV
jgi:hypothetical protein